MIHLPHDLTKENVQAAVMQVELYFLKINEAAAANNLPPICEVLPHNALSGLVSELMVSALANTLTSLVKNTRSGGFPDLLPADAYPLNSALRGTSGLEVKASKNGAWQGHNSEEGCFLAIKYDILPSNNVKISDVYANYLTKEDWTFCPRKENSRRTPTASINKSGLKKLRDSLLYRNGDFHGLERRLEQASQNADHPTQDT